MTFVMRHHPTATALRWAHIVTLAIFSYLRGDWNAGFTLPSIARSLPLPQSIKPVALLRTLVSWGKSVGELIDQHEVAKLLGVTTRTLRTWIKTGQVPRPIRIGRKQFWVKSVLDAWLKDRAQSNCDRPSKDAPDVPRVRRGRPRLPS